MIAVHKLDKKKQQRTIQKLRRRQKSPNFLGQIQAISSYSGQFCLRRSTKSNLTPTLEPKPKAKPKPFEGDAPSSPTESKVEEGEKEREPDFFGRVASQLSKQTLSVEQLAHEAVLLMQQIFKTKPQYLKVIPRRYPEIVVHLIQMMFASKDDIVKECQELLMLIIEKNSRYVRVPSTCTCFHNPKHLIFKLTSSG